MAYNNTDMEVALDADALDGQSDCFVRDEDGRVLFSAKVRENQPHNYLNYFDQNSNLSNDAFARLHDELTGGQSGIVQYGVDDTEYCLVYQLVGFQDWMMLGVVPKGVVNAAMSQIQWFTVVVLSGIFVLIGIISIVFCLGATSARSTLRKPRSTGPRTASRPWEMLEAKPAGFYEVVFMDIQMPVMDG